jgi:hypothetical protein
MTDLPAMAWQEIAKTLTNAKTIQTPSAVVEPV